MNRCAVRVYNKYIDHMLGHTMNFCYECACWIRPVWLGSEDEWMVEYELRENGFHQSEYNHNRDCWDTFFTCPYCGASIPIFTVTHDEIRENS
jgi:hypothetical protein